MSSLSREVQRNRLHRTIWEVANELRGAVDGWDFKSYVLGMLFYRFISENLASFIEKNESEDFSYANLTDEQAEPIRDMMVDEKGFFILSSQLFENVRARAHRTRTSTKPWRRFFRASKVRRWGMRVRMT
ncbi:type I restriction-modification system subunit M N-terminal domain-containing protein [Dermabacter jinjuensis]|uniref:type I restriction-modification system subunit M N-terminal domain-containing protein n=1 Tax=Dermabacter jinjuensis TaxID=1667168 RepID=UPI001D04D405|nr:type I restriction-modification system subunit M N-terminal domain-containing protein [Dermabacter jinjuensis]